jgi:8-oxo-dGTP pyrophosphatase MutT (NUDIX family)|tara:strand:+ start:410 stop:823 length:414 start_codon:yes stop_codon:yes gene_type:complete
MKEAISSGVILFNDNGNVRQYLLLNYPTGHWDFIKGGMEDGENPRQTSIREAKEETGITDIEFIDGYEEKIEYFFRANNHDIHKKVIFFLAKTNSINVKLSHEHLNFIWLDYENALKKLTYDNAVNLLKKSEQFLQN